MEIPLLDWGGRNLRKEERGLELENLSSEMTLLRRRLGGELDRLRLQLRDARERYESLRLNAVKAKDVFLLTKSRYAVGNALAVEVLAAQQSITDAEAAALQTASEIDLISARMIQLTTQQER
jgi:outer membrane protein TolC